MDTQFFLWCFVLSPTGTTMNLAVFEGRRLVDLFTGDVTHNLVEDISLRSEGTLPTHLAGLK